MSKRTEDSEEKIKCRPNTAGFDLQVKAEYAEQLLLQGSRIRLLIQLKGVVRSPLDAARAPIDYFIKHLQSGRVVGDPSIRGHVVEQLFEPCVPIGPKVRKVRNPYDNAPHEEDGDDLLPQYQLEVLVQSETNDNPV